MKNHFPLLLLNFFSDFELRALTCKDKDGDESGSAVAHDIYKAQWAKIKDITAITKFVHNSDLD